MKFFLIPLIGLMLTSIVLAKPLFSEENDNMKINLTISINKSIFKVGDDFLVNFTLKNNSTESVLIVPWFLVWKTNYIDVCDANGNKLRSFTTVMREPRMPMVKDLVKLDVGKEFKSKIEGKIIEIEKVDINNQIHKGIFLDLSDEFIPLKIGEKLTVKGKWQFTKEDIWSNEKIPKNVWFGELISNDIDFKIIKDMGSGHGRGQDK